MSTPTPAAPAGRTFVVSDNHYSHRLVAGLRGFATTDEHDDTIDANYRSVVGPQDVTWWLGDLAVTSNSAKLAAILERIGTLPGTKHLIAGNHDPVHPMHRHAHRHQRQYLEVFASVQAYARRNVSLPGPDGNPVKTSVLLSHFPYTDDHSHIARFPQYRLPDLGSWLWHGHTHSPLRRTSAREIHVGVDAWNFTPVSVERLAAEMQVPLDGAG